MTPVQFSWMLVLAAGVNSCIGNLLLKQSRLANHESGLGALLFSPWFIGGLAFYGINVILFAKALDHLPVSSAYPVLACAGFALLGVASYWLFRERLGAMQIVGMVLIVAGIFFLAAR